VYVTYTDRSPNTSDTNVYVRFSDDGGATWSPESKVNDDIVNAYQFHPSISVAPNGRVGVSFYDTRDDQPSNEKTHQYFAVSVDGGVTWSPNLRVTTEQSDESGFGDPNDYGDYQGLDATSRNTWHVVWTDSRPAAVAEDMFAARVRA
jgi:Neuraminidase (sialidase)